ncbi:MAG TPA: glycosyltransferase family 1 protein [Solirubrobacteraceae bacterium]|nr:glycosyltransferase family 1 protein [Solirubrobacteraceae bacterium]
MRILVDATVLASRAAGLSSYVNGLVPALAAVPGVRVTAVAPCSIDGVATVAAPASVARLPARAAWRERNLRRIAADAGADVLLAPSPELPLRGAGVPSIMVVHDVFPLSSPALVGRAKRLRFAAMLPAMCARADAVVCVSRATALALHRTVGVAGAEVIGEGPSPLPAGAEPASGPRPYVLAVGEPYRRKNLDVLLRALPLLEGVDLVLAGPPSPPLLAAARALGVEDRVRHEGWVAPERLSALFRGAAALVLPSLDEGFGRALLDAMALGTPAIGSDIPALRELGGDAPRLVPDPADPAQWAEAIATVAADAALRRDMAERGRARAADHTWERAAAAFAALARGLVA